MFKISKDGYLIVDVAALMVSQPTAKQDEAIAALADRLASTDVAISSEQTTRSLADDSLLARIQLIEAHLGVAYIETEVTARAEADGVFAAQVNLYDVRNPSHKPDDPSTWVPA